jgi:voltage-gated potassium channel
MLSKVPIFSKLSPNEISEIIPLLYSKKFEMGEIICRKGDLASTMYFILRGMVDIQLEHKSIQLSTGDFFGEIALIEKKARQNNITALSICKMLLIDSKDFEILLKRNATIAKSIHSVAIERSKITMEEQKHHPIHIL